MIGFKFFRAPFRPSRQWRFERNGQVGDGTRWQPLWCFQSPFGMLHIYGRWSPPGPGESAE